MNPGDLVRIKSHSWGSYTNMYQEIHGVFVAEFGSSEIGIILDFCYSHTDVPYVQIHTSGGKQGWIRYEKVDVLRIDL